MPPSRLASSPVVRTFSSLKLTILLMGSIGATVGYATFRATDPITQGIPRATYGSWWFLALLTLLGMNLLACTLRRYPYRIHQVGFLTVHTGLLIILGSSMVSFRLSEEGVLLLSERPVEGRVSTQRAYATRGYALEISGGGVETHSIPWEDLAGPRRPSRRQVVSSLGAVWLFGMGLFLLQIWEKGRWYRPVPFLFLVGGAAVVLWQGVREVAVRRHPLPGTAFEMEAAELIPHAQRRSVVERSDAGPPAAWVEVLLAGRVQEGRWLREGDTWGRSMALGPLTVTLAALEDPLPGDEPDAASLPESWRGSAHVVLWPRDGGARWLATASGDRAAAGDLAEGESLAYPFSGPGMPALSLRLLRALGASREGSDLRPSDSEEDPPGVRIVFWGRAGDSPSPEPRGGVALWGGDADPTPLPAGIAEGGLSLALRPGEVPLPFSVTLEGARVVRYPGTQRERSFEADLRVDPASGAALRQTVRVNWPLVHDGYRIYLTAMPPPESSGGVQLCQFSVARDPGTAGMYAGFWVLGAGFILIFYVKPILLRRATVPATAPSS